MKCQPKTKRRHYIVLEVTVDGQCSLKDIQRKLRRLIPRKTLYWVTNKRRPGSAEVSFTIKTQNIEERMRERFERYRQRVASEAPRTPRTKPGSRRTKYEHTLSGYPIGSKEDMEFHRASGAQKEKS